MNWPSLLPPLIVLLVAALTRRVLPALSLGILSASLIATKLNLMKALTLTLQTFWQETDLNNMLSFGFILLLGTLIYLIQHGGGMNAYTSSLKKKLKTRESAEKAAIGLSLAVMFDDFFSCITVGSIMQSLTDHFRIPRVKLAYLVDSLAAPMVVLMPISSWIAVLTMQLVKGGIADEMIQKPLFIEDPFMMFISTIPLNFYSIILFISVLTIIFRRISYGPMAKQEQIAYATGNVFGGGQPCKNNRSVEPRHDGTLSDFIFPLATLVISIFIYLLYTGNYWLFGGLNGFVTALHAGNIFAALFSGALTSLILSLIRVIMHGKLKAREISHVIHEGAVPMFESITILWFAWIFSSLLKNNLGAGEFLAHLLIGTISVKLFPLMFFMTSTLISVTTGSSWGAMSVMVPIAVPMIASLYNITAPVPAHPFTLLYVIIGAIFAGAVVGDHISPLASTTILASSSSGARLHDHLLSQFFYALPVLISTSLAYLVAGYSIEYGYGVSIFAPLFVGILSCLIQIIAINAWWNKKHPTTPINS